MGPVVGEVVGAASVGAVVGVTPVAVGTTSGLTVEGEELPPPHPAANSNNEAARALRI